MCVFFKLADDFFPESVSIVHNVIVGIQDCNISPLCSIQWVIVGIGSMWVPGL